MATLTISISDTAWKTLVKVAAERGDQASVLAENAVEETCLDERKRRGWTEADLDEPSQGSLLGDGPATIILPEGWPRFMDLREPEGVQAFKKAGPFDAIDEDGNEIPHLVAYNANAGRAWRYATDRFGRPKRIPGSGTLDVREVEGTVRIVPKSHNTTEEEE